MLDKAPPNHPPPSYEEVSGEPPPEQPQHRGGLAKPVVVPSQSHDGKFIRAYPPALSAYGIDMEDFALLIGVLNDDSVSGDARISNASKHLWANGLSMQVCDTAGLQRLLNTTCVNNWEDLRGAVSDLVLIDGMSRRDERQLQKRQRRAERRAERRKRHIERRMEKKQRRAERKAEKKKNKKYGDFFGLKQNLDYAANYSKDYLVWRANNVGKISTPEEEAHAKNEWKKKYKGQREDMKLQQKLEKERAKLEYKAGKRGANGGKRKTKDDDDDWEVIAEIAGAIFLGDWGWDSSDSNDSDTTSGSGGDEDNYYSSSSSSSRSRSSDRHAIQWLVITDV